MRLPTRWADRLMKPARAYVTQPPPYGKDLAEEVVALFARQKEQELGSLAPGREASGRNLLHASTKLLRRLVGWRKIGRVLHEVLSGCVHVDAEGRDLDPDIAACWAPRAAP